MYREIEEKLIAYYQLELNYTKRGLEKETDPIQRSDICWYALQRCLGAGQFANSMGLPYEIMEMLFEAMRTNLQELENGG
jgi:hypothetical protein